MSDFDKLLEEELEKQKKKKKKQQTTSVGNLIGNSFSYLPSYTSPAQDIASRLTAFDESDIAPLISRGLREEILAPTKSKEDDSELDFFQKGAFSDGYQFGDVTKSILGTVGDAGLGITKGLLGLSEGVGDLVTYGIAGVADAFGFEDDADRFKRNAQKNATDELFRGATNYLDQYSVLGRTSDAVMQGIGQVGGIMATGGIGAAAGLGTVGTTALTTGVMGLSGMGSGIGEAYQGGATDGEALTYGAISGTADALTELLFGGLGKAVNAVGLSKGISSVDDMLAKKVSGLFKTHIAKNIAEFGIKAGAEGFEEVLAGIAQGIGKKITYADDKELSEIMEDENLLEQFIVGAVTSGIAQAPGLHIANKTNADFITGQTQQEQDVLKKVVEQRIAELEAEGKTLTKKQKGEIEADVLEQMEKGYISTETIEEVLGGENYTAYQDTIKQDNDALAELAELYEGEELKQRAEEFLNNSKRSEMAKTLSDSVYDMVKDTRLGESYRDRARRGQKFEADVTQYDEKQRAIVQKAIDSGVLNNTNRTHDMVDFIARVSADTGVLFDFTNNEKLKDSIFAVNGKTVDGYITKDGITINVNSPRYINSVVGHEITHALEGTELYETLETALFEYAKEKGNYKDVLKDAYEMYSGEEGYQGYEGLKKIKKEAVANLVGEYLFTDKNFINHLSANHQNIFQKAWNEVKYMVKIARAGSNEAKKLLEVQKAFEEAYRNGGKDLGENANVKESIGAKYSLSANAKTELHTALYDKNYRNEVLLRDESPAIMLSQKGVKNLPMAMNASHIRENVFTEAEAKKLGLKVDGHTHYHGLGEVFFLNVIDGLDNVKLAYRGTKNAADPSRRENYFLLVSEFKDQDGNTVNVPVYIDEHAQVNRVFIDVNKISTVFGREEFQDYINRQIKSGNLVRIKNRDTKTSERDTLIVPGYGNDASSEVTLSQEDPNVKHSLPKDTNGNELSAEQYEYFKDSKVVDENGNLKVIYHGTPNGDYTIFKDGTYFTDNKEYADRYQNPGASSISTGKVASNPKTFEVYLDIKKPFDLNDAEARDIYINEYIKGGNAMGINPYLSDAEYAKIKTIDWTEGEDLREFLIDNDYDYDGLVLDEGADGGYGNEVKSRGTSYVIFSPEQAKNIDNAKPTADPDIRLSLSNEATEPAKNGNWHISGKDVAYEEIAPVAQTTAKTKQPVSQTKFVADEPAEELFPDDREELTNLLSHQFELRGALESAVSMGDTNTMSMLTQEYEDVTARIRELEAQESERLDSIDDADAPPEMETQHDEVADTTPLNKKTVTDLTKKVKPLLGLKNNRTGELVSVIEAYSRSENASSEQLFNELKEKFGKFTEKTVDEPTKEVKALLRGYKINVSDSIKSEIADYGDLMRRNFGRVRFSKEGMNVDEVYEDLSAGYPGYFPEDIINPTDQLMQIIHVANMEAETVSDMEVDDDSLVDAARTIARTVRAYKQSQMQELSNREARESFDSLMKSADKYAPADDIAPVKQKEKTAKIEKPAIAPEGKIKTVKERLTAKMQDLETELANNRKLREESWADYDSEIARAQAEYNAKGNKNTVAANDLLRRIERLNRMKHNTDADYAKRISDLEARTAKVAEEVRTGQSNSEQGAMRQELHGRIMSDIRTSFDESGYDFDNVLRNAKNLSTFATVDNTPQRVMEKALGYKQGQILSNLTVNKVAQNETEGIKWLNNFTDRKDGVLAKLSKQYHIKPGSKASAAAQMYAEGFYVNGKNEIVQYGDAELAQDFPNAKVRANIKGLARDPRIRQIYDGTLDKINESRARNAYPEIQKLDNYFLHFRAMDDTFSKLGIPFNPNDIKAKDLPTDLNGVTADLKPGQPYFASAMHRTGKRTSFDLLGGLERYLSSAKNQIYHIDDIQTLRALRNYVADTYGQAHGLESLDLLTEEEAQERIDKVYGSHLSTFAKFLNEEANIIAGKTALIDRGLEGIIGRRGITFLNTVNKQVGSNMVGFNVSSSLTNFLPVAQTLAKTNKFDFVKAFAQTVSNKVGSVFGKGDGFAENSPVFIRRKGEERFYRTPWQKAADAGYMLMGAVDDISTELIARTKYNELTRKGMDSKQAHYETDKWVSRLMGDRSLGQQPQLYNSKMLGMITKFQLEVRNQLDAQFYDTIQEEKASNEHIQNGLLRNAKTAAKVGSTFFQLAVVQHLFGKAFESIAGYNPAFDIISVLIKAFGWDDDEDDEDTVLDNIEEGFLELMGDLPYTSTMTGGRIPISSALPVKQFVTGKDQYGNEKSRWETLAEAAPYYVLPGGYGQAKKTYQGLSMFDDEHPVAGSYTNSGNLRFPVEDTLGNRVQAGLFGQYASENARDYFDNERSPLKPNQIQEYIDVDLPIREYWDYREGLSEHPTLDAKGDYIGGLDLPVGKKNILINNIAKREEPIDMANYAKYPNFKEFDWAEQNEEKYAFLQDHGMSYADYEKLDEDSKKAYTWAYNNPEKYAFVKEQGLSAVEYNALDDDTKDAYSWAYENPEMYTVSKAVSSDFLTYYQYRTDLGKLDAKNEKGESVSGLKKERVIDYINGLDIDYGQKIILFRSMYDGKADQEAYNADIVDYLNSRDDLSYSEMVTILKKLGFTVYQNGTVTW